MAQFKLNTAASFLALTFAMPAFAQQSPAPTEPPKPAAEKSDVIVITANKREETVQDIAVAVTAVTSEQRDELGIQTMQDLTNYTPGLVYSTANDRITLRGIGRNTNNFGTEPGVANYIDGIYTSYATLGGREPIFLERTEVVRGPQGTLYGRNSIGGAINLISKRPTKDLYIEGRVGYGNFDQQKYQFAASGPINDGLRWRVAAAKLHQGDGWYTNRAGGPSEGGAQDQEYIEAQLEGNIGETFDWWLKLDHTHYENRGAPGGRTNTGTPAPYPTDYVFGSFLNGGDLSPRNRYAYSPGIVRTQVGSQTTNPTTTDLFAFNANITGLADLPESNSATYEMTYHAPKFDVKMLGGYIYYHYRLHQDGFNNSDGTPVTSFVCGPTGQVRGFGATCAAGTTIYPSIDSGYDEKRGFFSNEINIISTDDGPLQWIAGLYAYQENYGQPSYSRLPDQPGLETAAQNPFGNLVFTAFTFAPGTIGVIPYAPNPNRYTFFNNNSGLGNSYGVFGQVDYEINDQWRTTIGLRYSMDNKQLQETGRIFCFRTCFVPGNADVTRAVFTGRAVDQNGVEYTPPGVVSATSTNLSGVTYDVATGLASRTLRDNWEALTGTAGLEYRPDRDTLAFVKYSRGYKAGGFGANDTFTNFTPLAETDKELVDSYEIGYKRFWPGANLTTNIDAFFYNYKDQQVPVTSITNGFASTRLANLPKTQTLGIELEAMWSPIDNLNIMLSYGALDTEVKSGCCFLDGGDPSALDPQANRATAQYVDAFFQSTTPAAATGVRYGQSVKGAELPYAPKSKVALNVGYTWDFAQGSLLLSGSYFWRDGQYTSVFNRSYTYSPEFDQTDARLIWKDKDDRYTIIGFVRNVFDQQGYDSYFMALRGGSNTLDNPNTPANEATQGIYDPIPTLTPPRTYGVELQYRF